MFRDKVKIGFPFIVAILIGVGDLQGQTYFLTGEFDAWQPDVSPMVGGPSRYSYVITGGTNGQYEEFKVTEGTWDLTWPMNNLFTRYDAYGENTVYFMPGSFADGWSPNADRVGFKDPGNMDWELVGDFNNWNGGSEFMFSRIGMGLYALNCTITTVGTHLFEFKTPGTWNLSKIGADFSGAADASLTTVSAMEQVGFLLDLPNGRWTVGTPVLIPNNIQIALEPASQTVMTGSNAIFTVSAYGKSPIAYQWYRNGQDIAGATNNTLILNSVIPAEYGSYNVVVSNPYESVVSSTVSLAVLADGANGSTPTQPILFPLPPRPSGVSNLVIIANGWEPLGPLADVFWLTEMQGAIEQKVGSDYWVVPYDWVGSTPEQGAWTSSPQFALDNAKIIGKQLGKEIGNSFKYVHLIGHSAGAALIQTAADVIRKASSTTIVQTTFLDPFVGFYYDGLPWYGTNVNWSDDYFTPVDKETSPFGDTTGLPLPKCYAVDVSWAGPHQAIGFIGGGEVAVSSHGYPIDFYLQTITSTDPGWCGANYGFRLSKEFEGNSWTNNKTDEPVNTSPVPPCSPSDTVLDPNSGLGVLESVAISAAIDIDSGRYAVSSAAARLVGNTGIQLQSAWLFVPLGQSGSFRPMDGTFTNAPAWFALGIDITNAINFVQFDAAFTDSNLAQGLLTVYWNTNQIGKVDERAAETNLQTYRFQLPVIATNGSYTLSLRLDSYNNSSIVMVTNIETGFIGPTYPIVLDISVTNSKPLLQLTAPTNFTYLIENSTNLVDWTPLALLFNTNGEADFMDSRVTTEGARYYRATLQ